MRRSTKKKYIGVDRLKGTLLAFLMLAIYFYIYGIGPKSTYANLDTMDNDKLITMVNEMRNTIYSRQGYRRRGYAKVSVLELRQPLQRQYMSQIIDVVAKSNSSDKHFYVKYITDNLDSNELILYREMIDSRKKEKTVLIVVMALWFIIDFVTSNLLESIYEEKEMKKYGKSDIF